MRGREGNGEKEEREVLARFLHKRSRLARILLEMDFYPPAAAVPAG